MSKSPPPNEITLSPAIGCPPGIPNLAFAFNNQPQRNRLNATGGNPAPDFIPQQR